MRWFKNLSMTHKILLFAGLVLLPAFIGQLIAHSALEQAKKRMNVLYDGHLQSITGLVSAEAAINASEIELQRIMTAADPEKRLLLRETLEKRSRAADEALGSFAANSLDPESSSLIEGLLKNWEAYKELRFKGLQLAVNMRDQEARAIIDGTALKPLSLARNALAGLVRANMDSGGSFLSDSLLKSSRGQSILWVIMVLSALCAACLGLWLAGLFERPLAEVRSVLRQLAAGETEINLRPLEEENLHDLKSEVASLVSSHQNLDLALKQLARGEPSAKQPDGFCHSGITQTIATLGAALQKIHAASHLLKLDHNPEEEDPILNPMGLYGSLREIVRNIEQSLKTTRQRSQALSEHLSRISRGDLPLKVETGNVSLDQDALASINGLIDSLRMLSADSAQLTRSLQDADFNARIDPLRHGGVFRTIAEHINSALDLLSRTVKHALPALTGLAAGEIPAQLDESGSGPESAINAAVNRIAAAASLLRGDVDYLAAGMQQGQTSLRADSSRHGPLFSGSIEKINSMLDLFVSLLSGVAGIAQSLQASCREIGADVSQTIDELKTASSISTDAGGGLRNASAGSGQIITWFKETGPRLQDAASLIEQAGGTVKKAEDRLRDIESLSSDGSSLLESLSQLIRQYDETLQQAAAGQEFPVDSGAQSHISDLRLQVSRSLEELACRLSMLQEAAGSGSSALSDLGSALQQGGEVSQQITNTAQETVSLTSGINRTVEESAIRSMEAAQKIASALARVERLREKAAEIDRISEGIKAN